MLGIGRILSSPSIELSFDFWAYSCSTLMLGHGGTYNPYSLLFKMSCRPLTLYFVILESLECITGFSVIYFFLGGFIGFLLITWRLEKKPM